MCSHGTVSIQFAFQKQFKEPQGLKSLCGKAEIWFTDRIRKREGARGLGWEVGDLTTNHSTQTSAPKTRPRAAFLSFHAEGERAVFP